MHDALLFDLDGTLIDPVVGISRCINHALVACGHESVSVDTAARFIGPPLNIAFETIVGTTSAPVIDQLIAKYRERYSDVGYSECHLYAGVAESLAALRTSGIPMAVCTSKRVDFAERILNLFGIADHFHFVDGGEVRLSKVEQIKRLLSAGKISGRTIMIGDRAVDLIAAHTSDLQSAGVLWGYGSREELEAERPAHIFATPSEWLTLADSQRVTPQDTSRKR